MTDRSLHPWDEIRLPDPGAPGSPGDPDWTQYYDAIDGSPRETLLRALALFEAEPAPEGRPRHAVDLGCGEGRDSAELIRRGWRVTAVDAHPEAIRRLRRRPGLSDEARLSVVQATLEEVCIP